MKKIKEFREYSHFNAINLPCQGEVKGSPFFLGLIYLFNQWTEMFLIEMLYVSCNIDTQVRKAICRYVEVQGTSLYLESQLVSRVTLSFT